MKKIIALKEHLMELALVGLLFRSILVGAGIGDSIAIVSIVLSMAYTKFLNKEKIDATEEIQKKLEDLTNKVQSISLDRGLRVTKNEQQKPAGRYF